jgi:hypothetical protein
MVLLHPVSRAVMVGRVDLDENPRWRQRGHCRRRDSGGQCRQGTCAQASVSRGEGVDAVNREPTCRMRGNCDSSCVCKLGI